MSPSADRTWPSIRSDFKEIGLRRTTSSTWRSKPHDIDHGGTVLQVPGRRTFSCRRRDEELGLADAGDGPLLHSGADVGALRSDLGESIPNKFKVVQLTGELDIFGDVQRRPSRTGRPNSGAARWRFVARPKTGTVILTSDNVFSRRTSARTCCPTPLATNRTASECLRVHPVSSGPRNHAS